MKVSLLMSRDIRYETLTKQDSVVRHGEIPINLFLTLENPIRFKKLVPDRARHWQATKQANTIPSVSLQRFFRSFRSNALSFRVRVHICDSTPGERQIIVGLEISCDSIGSVLR